MSSDQFSQYDNMYEVKPEGDQTAKQARADELGRRLMDYEDNDPLSDRDPLHHLLEGLVQHADISADEEAEAKSDD